MLPQWPRVVWATTLQFPSKGAAIADAVEQMIAEAAARAKAQIRLTIMAVSLVGFVASSQFEIHLIRSPRRRGRAASVGDERGPPKRTLLVLAPNHKAIQVALPSQPCSG
jgi:hypothetical protein